MNDSNSLSLSKAIKNRRLQDFIAQEEARGIKPASEQELMATIGAAIKPPQLEDQTSRFPSRDDSSGK